MYEALSSRRAGFVPVSGLRLLLAEHCKLNLSLRLEGLHRSGIWIPGVGEGKFQGLAFLSSISLQTESSVGAFSPWCASKVQIFL